MSAVISTCGRYRYQLERWWGGGLPLLFVMLNPSTADASVDDPTIRKCIGFARRLGSGGIRVVNLFALRATNPRELLTAHRPVGPMNDQYIEEAWLASGGGIVAWGAFSQPLIRERAERVLDGLEATGRPAKCLGRSANGNPRHPLMLAYATPLEDFTADAFPKPGSE